MFNTLSENVYIAPIIAPVSGLGTTTQPAGAYIDVTNFDAFAFLAFTGVGDRTTQTIQVVQATAAAGTGSKNVSGAVNTTLTATDDGKFVIVQVRTEALDIANGFRYVAVTPAFSGGSGDLGAIIFMAWRARNLAITQPATLFQAVTV